MRAALAIDRGQATRRVAGNQPVVMLVSPEELSSVANALSTAANPSGSLEMNREAALAHALASQAWAKARHSGKTAFHNQQADAHLRAVGELTRSRR